MAPQPPNQDFLKQRGYNMLTEMAVDWTLEDIDFVREQRKFWANVEQRFTDKDTRKLCQKYVKATTIVLEFMTGRKGGKWDADPLTRNPAFPEELYQFIRAVFCFTMGAERIPFADIYKDLAA
jgi:hypothetical protein